MSGRPLNCLPLHETLNLYISNQSYVFEPSSAPQASHTPDGPTLLNEKDARETLHIDRRTGQMTLNATGEIGYGKEKVISCYGIIGILSLATTDFLLIITGRTNACRLLNQPIYLATDYRLLPLSPLSNSATILNHPVEKELLSLVESGLRGGRLWFSHGLDLTNSLQRQREQEERGDGAGRVPLWKRADDRFFWNKYLMGKLIEPTERGQADLSRFILPIVYGSIDLRSATLNNRELLFFLIARRSRYRAGTRYFTRGIDVNGNVANSNETEQIVLFDPLAGNGEIARRGRVEGKEKLSFVQTRGSVPVFWAEVNNLRYKPDLQIMDLPETQAALKLHLHQQIQIYQSVHHVNLVNHKGHELPVKEAFERAMSAARDSDPIIAQNAHYVYFDFHTECRKMRFDRVSVLIDRLAPSLDAMGWYHSQSTGTTGSGVGEVKVLSSQKGVIRTNCMDCLDRTNVTQSTLARWILNKQFKAAGLLSHKESIEDHDDFMTMFRNVWADHGDTVSCAYAGTGALKSDYTRTGQRSYAGQLQDGYNSVMRYVKNNFFDGDRQDSFDILTGAWVAKRGGIPPLTDTRPLLMRAMPYILAFALSMVFCALTLPRTSGLSVTSFLFVWFAMAIFSGTYIWGNGISYVAWPRLNPPIEVLQYTGPGAHSKQRGRGMSVQAMVPLLSRRGGAASVAGRKGEEVELGRRKGALID